MIISAMSGKPFSLVFILVNLITFFLQKLLLVDYISKNYSVTAGYVTMVSFAIITGIVYSIVYINHMRSYEEQIMKYSLYVEEYDCSIYKGSDIRYIIQLNNEDNKVYINKRYFFYTHGHDRKSSYINLLKGKLENIGTLDILYIYVYKYISMVLASVAYFSIFQLCIVSKINFLFLGRVGSVIAIIFIAAWLCCFIHSILHNIIVGVMDKRNLGFFVEVDV